MWRIQDRRFFFTHEYFVCVAKISYLVKRMKAHLHSDFVSHALRVLKDLHLNCIVFEKGTCSLTDPIYST